MTVKSISPKLLRLVIIIALPTVSCFGFYSVRDLAEESLWLTIPIVLAYPVTLISIIGIVSALSTKPFPRLRLCVWSIIFLVSIIFLITVYV